MNEYIIKFGDTDQKETFSDRQEQISWWRQQALSDGFVLVAGAGALGNEAIKNLALLGLGHMFIVDFDHIEISNLSRSLLFRMHHTAGLYSKAIVAGHQARQMNPNPEAAIYARHADLVWQLGLGVFRRANVVLGCVDNIEARMFINRYCRMLGKTWIDAGMKELGGSVTFFSPEPDTPCYECDLSDAQLAIIADRYSCGDAIKELVSTQREPTIQTTSAILSGIQSQEAVKVLHGFAIPAGRHVVYRGQYHNFVPDGPDKLASVMLVANQTVNPKCTLHQLTPPTVIELPTEKASSLNLGSLFQIAESHGLENPTFLPGAFRFEYVFVAALTCHQSGCGRTEIIEQPIFKLRPHDLVCPYCTLTCHHCQTVFTRDELTPTMNCPSPTCGAKQEVSYRLGDTTNGERFTTFAQQSSKAFYDHTLEALGIPPLDIIAVRGQDGSTLFFELTGDTQDVLQLPAIKSQSMEV